MHATEANATPQTTAAPIRPRQASGSATNGEATVLRHTEGFTHTSRTAPTPGGEKGLVPHDDLA